MLRFLTAGESHGRALIGQIESFPAGLKISIDKIDRQLTRRQGGFGRGGRMKIEHDRARILSGLRQGITLGSPIAIMIENRDWPNWKKLMDPIRPVSSRLNARQQRLANDTTRPRPGHADLSGAVKYDTHDLRNVLERASARETAARVACGAIAGQLLEHFDIRIASHVLSIGRARMKRKKIAFDDIVSKADRSEVRCIDPAVSAEMKAEIKAARKNGDTLGGVFEVRISNLPIGLGSMAQWFTRLDGALAAAMMSIQSVKGVEIGDGFASAAKKGSAVHDALYYNPSGSVRSRGFYRRTNRAGGIEGGMTNGSELIIRAACKPIATLMKPLETVDIINKSAARAITERSDVCVVPAAAVVGEAMMAMVMASAFTDKFGNDSLTDIEAAFEAYLKREF